MIHKLGFIVNSHVNCLSPISTFVFNFSASTREVGCLKGKISFAWDKESKLSIQAVVRGRLVEFMLGRREEA